MRKIVSFVFSILIFFFLVSQPTQAAVSTWQKGISIMPTSSEGWGSDSFAQSLTNLRNTGANYVTFIIPYYQSSLTSTDLSRGADTPSDAALIKAIDTAHSLGLQVMLKFHPEVKANPPVWRAEINPTNRAEWFANYTTILKQYAQIAKDHSVEQMALGAELIKLDNPQVNPSNTNYWLKLIQDVKTVYSGKLTYSASRSDAAVIGFWSQLDYIGIEGYFEFPASSTTVDSLKQGWQTHDLKSVFPLYQKFHKPILFTEIGYRSLVNNQTDPWNWQRSGAPDQDIQANLCDAFFSYWNNKDYVQGVHWWHWLEDPNGGGAANTDYTPQNKKAQEVMTTWFKNGSNGGVNTNITPTPAQPNLTPTGVITSPTPSPTSIQSNLNNESAYDWKARREQYMNEGYSETEADVKIKEDMLNGDTKDYHPYEQNNLNTNLYNRFQNYIPLTSLYYRLLH